MGPNSVMNHHDSEGLHAGHHSHPSCGDKPFSLFNREWTLLAEKISSVALAMLAAYTSFRLFLPFFIVGIGVGAYCVHNEYPITRSPSVISGCLSNAAPVNLPSEISLAGAVGITAAHIDHHPGVAVPFQAIIAGMQTVAFAHWCYKSVRSPVSQNVCEV